MELKVWVEGIQRIVCGVTERTTCQDVVYALAHATGKTGRFTLIERWRNNERLLAPHEHPLKVLMKWGEYSNDVHLILQRTALDSPGHHQQNNGTSGGVMTRSRTVTDAPLHGVGGAGGGVNGAGGGDSPSTLLNKEMKKSLTFSGHSPLQLDNSSERILNIGVVRGVAKHSPPAESNGAALAAGSAGSAGSAGRSGSIGRGGSHNSSMDHLELKHSPSGGDNSPADGNYHLVYPRYEPPYGRVRASPEASGGGGGGTSSALSQRAGRSSRSPGSNNDDSPRLPPPYRDPPPPFSGARCAPPPYREPPRPRGMSPSTIATVTPTQQRPTPTFSPLDADDETSPYSRPGSNDADDAVRSSVSRTRRNLGHEFENGTSPSGSSGGSGGSGGSDVHHHGQLVQLVKRQRGKVDEQQQRLAQLEQELIVSEANLANIQQLDHDQTLQWARQLTHLQQVSHQHDTELASLAEVQGEWEDLCHQEQRLKDELARLETQTTSVESQFEDYQPTIRNLSEELKKEEQRLVDAMETELASVKGQLQGAERLCDAQTLDSNQLTAEFDDTEDAIRRIKEDMEHLTQEIKEANLQSLSIAPADDLKVLLEGSYKTGHGRRMLGSPRQLENAVPTNKNPHGVWV